MNDDHVHDVDVRIQFPVDGDKLDLLSRAMGLMREAGIGFDSGYDGVCLNWEFDWSLKGAYVKFRRTVDDDERKCRWYQHKISQAYSGEPEHLRCSVLLEDHREVYIIVYGKEEDFGGLLEIKFARLGIDIVRNGEKVMGYENGDDFIRVAYTGDAC